MGEGGGRPPRVPPGHTVPPLTLPLQPHFSSALGCQFLPWDAGGVPVSSPGSSPFFSASCPEPLVGPRMWSFPWIPPVELYSCYWLCQLHLDAVGLCPTCKGRAGDRVTLGSQKPPSLRSSQPLLLHTGGRKALIELIQTRVKLLPKNQT